MKGKLVWIWLIVLASAVVVVATTTVSLAIWTRNEHENTYIKTHIEDENPSLKYQMYVPVKASGDATTTTTSAYQRIAGTFAVSGDVYSYTVTNAAEIGSIVGFSLAGWYGGVSLEYIDIPDEVTVTVNGSPVTKPVVQIKPGDDDYSDYIFGGVNTAITDITIGANVKEVCQGAFCGMAYVKNITIKQASAPIYLYPYCFGGCPNLEVVDNNRISPEGWSTSYITYNSFSNDD